MKQWYALYVFLYSYDYIFSKVLIVEQNLWYQVKRSRKSIDSACTLPQVTPIEFGPKQNWPGIPDKKRNDPITSRHGNAFLITGFCERLTGEWLIPAHKGSVRRSFDVFFDAKQAVKQTPDLRWCRDAHVTLLEQNQTAVESIYGISKLIVQTLSLRLCMRECVTGCFSMKNTYRNLDTPFIKNWYSPKLDTINWSSARHFTVGICFYATNRLTSGH